MSGIAFDISYSSQGDSAQRLAGVLALVNAAQARVGDCELGIERNRHLIDKECFLRPCPAHASAAEGNYGFALRSSTPHPKVGFCGKGSSIE